jgi:two-component system, LytTR family, sensor kinase
LGVYKQILERVFVHRTSDDNRVRWPLVWLISFAAWTLIAFYYTGLRYKWQHDMGMHPHFWALLLIPLLNCWIAAVSTPGVVWLVRRYPIEQSNWKTRVPVHVMGSLLFTAIHVVTRLALLPMKDEAGQVVRVTATFAWRLFVSFTYDDALTTYWPILILVQMLAFHRRSRQNETQALQLETELAKAHLQRLKSQLQPHFLFNTLNSISALMHIDVKAADRMISQLSDLLRLSLDSGDVQESTVREELDFVQGYLRIEQTRFSDRLAVSFDVDPETYDAKIPHMLLQPLVENAVRHGIAKRSYDGRIDIAVHREGNRLALSVRDNGMGFDLQRAISNGGVGLRNTRERLRTLYGDEQELSVNAIPEDRVEVRVSLPFIQVSDGTEAHEEYVPVKVG